MADPDVTRKELLAQVLRERFGSAPQPRNPQQSATPAADDRREER